MQQQHHTKTGVVIYTTNRCAVCRRERHQRTYKSVRKIAAGLILALLCVSPLMAQSPFPCTTMADGASCQVTQIFLTGHYRLDVFAWEQGSGPTFPTLEMQVDGVKVGSLEIQYGDPAGFIGPFYFEADVLSGSHVVSAVYRGDGGRQLVVKSITSTLLSAPPVTTLPTPPPVPLPPSPEWQVAILSVAPSFVDTQAPVITGITYGASTPANGATLAATGTSFEFRVTATDNTAIAYATLELLKAPTDTIGKFILVMAQSEGPLPSPIRMIWNQKLNPGTYYLRATVVDPLGHSAAQVFTVKK